MVVAEHSIDESLLTGGWVVDVGARNFGFTKPMLEYGKVLAIEPDDVLVIKHPNLTFLRAAIWNRNGFVNYVSWGNGTGNYCIDGGAEASRKCYTLQTVLDKFNITEIDVLKLDCEGAEYDLLLGLETPIAKQITVEFHEHTQAKRGAHHISMIIEHLSQWYEVRQHVLEERHGAGFNYWDTLLIRK